jgi:hypothetical protein
VHAVTATYSVGPQPSPGRHPLGPGASPAAIRSALLPEDRAGFDEAYDAALAEARTSRDLTGLFRMLERWRGIAALQADPKVFRDVARRAAEKLTGQASPQDEPLAVTRRKAGL